MVLSFIAVAGAVCVNGCGDRKSDTGPSTNANSSGGAISIVCTTGMVANLVKAVGGDRVQVQAMMGPGVDPHVYAPTVADNEKLLTSDVIFYSGLHLEPGFLKVFKTLGETKPVVGIADPLQTTGRLKKLDGEFYDPHVWFDPKLWGQCIDPVVETLSKVDPEHAQQFADNGEKYRNQLKELHEYGQARIGTLPPSNVLVTAHDAFSYFGSAFGIDVVGIQGVSTETEAGVGRINEIVDMLIERKVKAVFVESSLSDRNVQALIEGCQERGHEVQLGGELYSDALGPADSNAGEYIGMVRHNIDTIAQALGSDE